MSLADVIGLRAAKREVESLVARLIHPEIILEAGGDLPRGVLFYGPPGCGKTLLARVMASLLVSADMGVEFYSLAASDLNAERFEELGRWLGSRDHDTQRIVIYVDEIDLWARDRDDFRHTDATRGTLLAALAAIDGLGSPGSRNQVLWLASSNRNAELDRALVRAGRFGFSVRISWPSLTERAEILAHYARGRRVAEGIDWRRAAALAGMHKSPADLRQALDDALALALSARGREATIGWMEVSEAIMRGGRIVDDIEPPASQLWETAVHESGHAVANLLLGFEVTAMTLRRDGGVTEATMEDEARTRLTAADLSNRITVALAGLAAERLILGHYGLGGGDDVAAATRAAIARINEGVDPATRPLRFGDFENSPAAQDELFLAAAAAVSAGRSDAEGLVSANRTKIETLAQRLVEARHLSGRELRAALIDAGLESIAVVEPTEPVGV